MPKTASMEKWAVIACDQFTSDPAYWQRVRERTQDAPSAMHLILPEAELGTAMEEVSTQRINQTMLDYLAEGVFESYPDCFVYVERTLLSGAVRKGLIGKVDLEAYDYAPGSVSAVRATEKTVVERIPPRRRVRQNAPLEFPHILMLCDDDQKELLEPIAAGKDKLPPLYAFDLMEGGGHIAGYLVAGEIAKEFEARLEAYSAKIGEKYIGLPGTPMVFAVGDGNHSLATAKACYEALKAAHPDEDLSNHPARYALVELENIHDEAQQFEPIHRILTNVEPKSLLAALEKECGAPEGFLLRWFAGEESGTLYLNQEKGQLAVGILQSFLDDYLEKNPGELDYIHGDAEVKALARQENAVGFLLPVMGKGELFRGVIADGILPRKTFSMGHAVEKRYYLEGRKIK